MTDGSQGLQAASLRVVSATSESGTTPICTCGTDRGMHDDAPGHGGKIIVVIEGMVVASAGSTIINSGAVNANVKNTGYTERDEVQTIINAGRDLTISKSDMPDPVVRADVPRRRQHRRLPGGLPYTFVRRQQRRAEPANAWSSATHFRPARPTTTPPPKPDATRRPAAIVTGVITEHWRAGRPPFDHHRPGRAGHARRHHEHGHRRPEQRDLRIRRDQQHR